MNIREVLTTLNRLQADGVVGPCAIGGAVGGNHQLVEAWQRFTRQFLNDGE